MAGPAGVLPCLELPTYGAACALLSSRYSCLVAGPHRRHIALSPRYLHRKRTGIREQLDAELLRYSERSRPLPSRALVPLGPGRGPRVEVLMARERGRMGRARRPRALSPRRLQPGKAVPRGGVRAGPCPRPEGPREGGGVA